MAKRTEHKNQKMEHAGATSGKPSVCLCGPANNSKENSPLKLTKPSVEQSISEDVNVAVKQTVMSKLLLPKASRRSLFFYGSANALMTESQRAEKLGTCIIHPFSTFRNYYISFMLIVTFLNLVIIPIGISFLKTQEILEHGWVIFNLISDTLYLIDIAFNFRTGIVTDDSEVVIMDPKQIRNLYLKSWFVPDLIAAIPADYFAVIYRKFGHDGEEVGYAASRLFRIILLARVLSLLRLLRFSRLMRLVNEWEQVLDLDVEITQLFSQIFSLFLTILLLCHWNGCIQFLIPALQSFPVDSWVVKENLTNAWWVEQYSFSVFRALSHMLCIGYGADNLPSDTLEIWAVIISVLSGAMMYTIMLANVAALITNANPAVKAYRDKEVLSHLCSKLVRSVPLFCDRDPNFVRAVIVNLHYTVFQEGDIIIQEGAFGDKMFFIEKGSVLVQTGSYQKQLSDGDFFGEICLVVKCYRTATVRALTICHLFSLSVRNFEEVLQMFPEVQEDILETASDRLQALHGFQDTQVRSPTLF
nr:PREDICTED: potassium/sodium hyperpolarization-activated cyclic nucleotide-gated channel 2-like isoform X2 [Latimeria chalumnae]|eukprot:XP_014344895.1 PREDICTED: potassium/sodium hyperpolarization-activated cyclic nucleotide-gated channel 2-like isoform X2 [Latimeria chalumnae]